MPVVKFIERLDLEQNISFLDRHELVIFMRITGETKKKGQLPETMDYSTLSPCNLARWCYFYLFCFVNALGIVVIMLN